MALPALLRKLFKSSGYGSELNDGVVSKTISNQDWSNAYNYPVGAVARGSNGVLYYSAAQSGPGTSAGARNPVNSGSPYWVSLNIAALESNINNALANKVSTSTYNSGMATKVALDGSNASSIGKTLSTYMANASMPTFANFITVSIPYTAPADGWMHYEANANFHSPDNQVYHKEGNIEMSVFRCMWDGSSNTVSSVTNVAIKKGTYVRMFRGSVSLAYFWYANGSKP